MRRDVGEGEGRGERLSVMKEGIGGGNELGSDLGLLYVGENRVRSTLHPIPIPILYQPKKPPYYSFLHVSYNCSESANIYLC